MKTRIILVITLLLCLYLTTVAQPQKGTVEIGGSGYYISSKGPEEGDKLKLFDLSPEIQYFIFKNLSVGGALTIKGDKNYSLANNDTFYGIFLSPSIEGYVLNRRLFGLSLKARMNIAASTNYNINETVTSYSFGPKVLWNITPSLSTYIWLAYRKLKDFDDTRESQWIIPSDNFDVRWGFSYYLQRKKDN